MTASPSEGLPGEPVPVSNFTAFIRGVNTILGSAFVVVTTGTYLGIGALSHDFGFSIVWSVACTFIVWAGPAQVILISGLGSGAALVEVAVAVTLSAVRLMPMIVSLVPIMRGPETRTRHLLLPAHFIAVMIWSLGIRLLPDVARANRIAFVNGMGVALTGVASIATFAGYYLAAGLPLVLAAALLMLTPLAFLMTTAGNVRVLSDKLALLIGLAVAPALAVLNVPLDLLWSGVIGGSIGYAVHRFRGGRS